MSIRNGHATPVLLIALLTLGVILVTTAAAPSFPAATLVTAGKTAPFPALTLNPGNLYFSIDGKQSFILSRNITGKTQQDFDTLREWARQGGTGVIRVHLTHGWWGDPWINQDWTVNERWAQDWDRFFDRAQADGIFVLPVFGVWADWNNGKPDYGSPLWQYNPLNRANGGPVGSPTDLFQPGSEVQKQWMAWVKALVERWQGRKNIAAWEIFSEINIASGAPGRTDSKGGVDEATGVDFTSQAMAIIHAADSQHHPVTLSLAGTYSPADKWAEYYKLDSLDFIEIHPYSDALDRELVKEVRQYQDKYHKPVLIGESGLWSMTHNTNASVGIKHAIWAGLASGAMNGRALWDNDGYSIYSISNRTDAIQFMQAYATMELPVANFARNVDFSNFKPLKSTSSSAIWGAAVGNENSIIGWYRDASCEPPDWKLKPVLAGQKVAITVPGQAANWRVDFYDTKRGIDLVRSITVARKGKTVTVPLPDFADDIAFRMTAQE